ncbi:MAG: (d)CMP kinase [Ruminococcus sp.]|nr:(d)CMP kinase [Ruminococcus sp.]MCD7801258.1 (d)CMP kinase [Ruminococcus sp.]
MSNINIAIDGPAGAGKSSVSKEIANILGYIYIDTGALYRAIAYYTYSKGVEDFSDTKVVELLDEIDIQLRYIDNVQRVFVNGLDVSDYIRTPNISLGASKVSAIPEVRSFLLCLQRDIAESNNIIMDGRDIGTVVLPNADLKIFLTASAEERANRRYNQIKDTPNCPCWEEILEDINQRDYNDTHREIAPLKRSDDAILLDTTNMNQDETIAHILSLIREIA